MLKSISLLAAFLFVCCGIALAQGHNGTIKGFVNDKKTGEPMIYTNVRVVNGNTGVQTDVNGYFSISLPAGSYTLMTSSVGYDSSVITVNLLPDAVVSKKILLNPSQVELKAVEISSHHAEKMTQVGTGVTTITPRELKLLPSAGGEPDVAQYLQVIPGVIFTGDQGGQLYIRGGSPAQTGIYLDGITIYNPFHSIGMFSVFETEAIRNVDVYTAGFDAQYGNRTSAIVDVHTKDGNKNEISGIVSVSPIMTRVMVDGPLVKSKKDDGSGVTFLVTGKSSYLDQTSKSLYSWEGEPFSSGLPYSFSDFFGKITFNGGNGSKLNIFGFDFNDKASLNNDTNFQAIANYQWHAVGAGATFVIAPTNSSSLIDGKLAFSNYNLSLAQVAANPLDTTPQATTIGGFEAAINFTYFLPNYSQLKYGVEVSGLHTSLNYYEAPGIVTTQDGQSTMAAMFVTYRHNFDDKFIFEPSFRLQYYSELQKFAPQPRIGVKYNINDHVRLKASGGIYDQNIISTKTDQDIVNLFSGFILSPDESIKDPHGNTVASNLQTAYHGVVGLEVDIKKVELNLEPWVKYFGQIDELNRDQSITNTADFIAATGLANGVDLSAKYSYQRIYFWMAAGYQNVTYTSLDSKGNVQTYPAPFDTRFNGNIVTSYTAGKHKDWDFSARFNIHAPFPFTQTQGFYENVPITSSITANPSTANGSLGVLYPETINGGRLSWYHRLDLSAKKRFKTSEKTKLDITFAITNVYDRQNVFYVDRITNEIIYQLPIFPSLNLTFSF
jgi:hypothetical protein